VKNSVGRPHKNYHLEHHFKSNGSDNVNYVDRTSPELDVSMPFGLRCSNIRECVNHSIL